jgi:hypothetical protein
VFNLAPLTPNPSLNDSSLSSPKQQLGMATPTKLQATSNVSRIVWCMYIPDTTNVTPAAADSPDNASKVFVLARNNRADIFHLGLILSRNHFYKNHSIVR